MKKYLILAAFLLLPISALAENVQITVRGMVCSFCAQGIEKNLGKLEGVSNVKVSLEKKEVTLVTSSDKVSDEQLRKVVNDAGYDVENITRAK
jgi:periplasmic mercuric ion binding protein